MSLQLCHVVLHCSSFTVWSCYSLERLTKGQGFSSDLSLNFTCFTNLWSVVLCLHFLLPSMTSCYKPCLLLAAVDAYQELEGCILNHNKAVLSFTLLYCAALASAPCWVGAQAQSSCSWGRNRGGEGVWKEWEWCVAARCCSGWQCGGCTACPALEREQCCPVWAQAYGCSSLLA